MPNWKKVIVSGSNAILNHITASGEISASGHLFASLSLDSSNFKTVMYDTSSGKFFFTGSYNVGGGSSGADTDWKEFDTHLTSSKDVKVTGSIYASSSLNAGTNVYAGELGFNDDEGGAFYSNGVPLMFHGEDSTIPGSGRKNYFVGVSNISESMFQGTPVVLRSNNTGGAAIAKNVAPHRVFVSSSLRLVPNDTHDSILEIEAKKPTFQGTILSAQTTFQNIIAPESGSNFISGLARATGSIGNISTYGGGASEFTLLPPTIATNGLSQVAIVKFPVARTTSLRVNSVSIQISADSVGLTKKGLIIFPGFNWTPNKDTAWLAQDTLLIDSGYLLLNGNNANANECGYGFATVASIGNFITLNNRYAVQTSAEGDLFDSDGNLNFGNNGSIPFTPVTPSTVGASSLSSSPLVLVKNTTTGDLNLIFYTHEFYNLLNTTTASPWTFNSSNTATNLTFTVNYESASF